MNDLQSADARHEFRRARFVTSAADTGGCPPDTGAEVAFAGRSNAGKSTALNALAGQRNLARTSKTPGRTQLLNFFACDREGQRRLVDLPGYGFARAPVAQRRRWGSLVDGYLRSRASLRALLLMVDCRRGLMDQDRQLVEWAGASGVPVHAVLTKSDKLSRSAGAKVLTETRRALGVEARVVLLSATKGSGLAEFANLVAASLDAVPRPG